MSGKGQAVVVVTDTSVLINFLRIDRMDLIARHSHRLLITAHVTEEITEHFPEQQARLSAALADGTLEELTVSGDVAMNLFKELSETHRLGSGESAAIACAIANDFAIAIDDRTAANQARRPESRPCRSRHPGPTGIIVVAIIRGYLFRPSVLPYSACSSYARLLDGSATGHVVAAVRLVIVRIEARRIMRVAFRVIRVPCAEL